MGSSPWLGASANADALVFASIWWVGTSGASVWCVPIGRDTQTHWRAPTDAHVVSASDALGTHRTHSCGTVDEIADVDVEFGPVGSLFDSE